MRPAEQSHKQAGFFFWYGSTPEVKDQATPLGQGASQLASDTQKCGSVKAVWLAPTANTSKIKKKIIIMYLTPRYLQSSETTNNDLTKQTDGLCTQSHCKRDSPQTALAWVVPKIVFFFIMHEVKKGYLSTEVTKRQKVEPGQYLALDGGQQLLKKC